jgi:hypothetical protein
MNGSELGTREIQRRALVLEMESPIHSRALPGHNPRFQSLKASGSLHHGAWERRPVSQISIQGGVPPFGCRRPVGQVPGWARPECHTIRQPVLVVFAYAAPAARRVDVDVNAFQSHKTVCTTKAAPIVGSCVWLRYRADQGDTDLEL